MNYKENNNFDPNNICQMSIKLYKLTKEEFEKKNNSNFNQLLINFTDVINNKKLNKNIDKKLNKKFKKKLLQVICENQIKLRKERILTEENIGILLKEAIKHSVIEDNEYWLDFEGFYKIKRCLNEINKEFGNFYFPCCIYSQLYYSHPKGWIQTFSLFSYLNKTLNIYKLMLQLSMYDNGHGYIK